MKRRTLLLGWGLVAVLLLTQACTANRAFRQAQAAEEVGDWDQAVLHYLELVDEFPNRVPYRTGLLRAKIRASQAHFERGKKFQDANALERAFAEYQQAVQLDPTNQYAQVELEKLRERLLSREGGAYYESLQDLKDRNRGSRPQPPVLSPRSDEAISLGFPRPVSVFDIYRALGNAFGINILFDPKMRDQQVAIELREVVAQDALEILMRTANHFYKVLDDSTIIVAEDSPQNRRNYEDLVIQTFFLSNAEVKDVMTMLRSLVGAKNVASNDLLNAIVLRDTADKVKVAERIIHTNDKARGEVVVDVELLQINSNKIRELGVELSQNFIVQSFGQADADGVTNNTVRVSDLEFINQGNWFVTIPGITYKFIKNSTDAELLASPQLRISDGEQATLHIGDRVPIPVTSFNTANLSGQQVVPITSFQYQEVGIRLDIEPRIHHNKEITLKLQVEVSDLSGFVEGTGGQNQPIIATRTIESTIRLKNGETNFLAGLIRTGEQKSETGLPGLSDIPVIGRLFSRKRSDKSRTDVVLTMTPHIIRTPDITEEDLLPIWVGTEANITFRGGSPRVESEVEGPFDEGGGESDAERIREMIRRRIQNLPRGLQQPDPPQGEAEEQAPAGIDLAPSSAPGDAFGGDPDEDPGLAQRSIVIVPDALLTEAPVDESAEVAMQVASLMVGDVEEAGEQASASSEGSATSSSAATETGGVLVALRTISDWVEIGSVFEVLLAVDAGTPVAHLPMTVEFDPRVLSFEGVEQGEFLGDADAVEVLANASSPGRVIVGASRLGEVGAVSGSGTLARLAFRAHDVGRSEIRLSRVKALDDGLAAVGPVLARETAIEVVLPGQTRERDQRGSEAEQEPR